MKKYTERLILWSLVVGAILGYLSGIIGIIRSVTLFFFLSLGTLIINYINRQKLDQQKVQNITVSMIIGLLSGIVAGTIIVLSTSTLYNKPGSAMFFMRPIENNAFIIITCCVYGISLHGAYALRWLQPEDSRHTRWFWLAAIICNIIRLMGESLNQHGEFYKPGNIQIDISTVIPMILGILITAALTSLPFTMAWYAVQKANDPAWTFERWETITNENNR